MTIYLSNRDGNGKTDEKGHYKFPSVAFSGEVVMPGLAVSQNSPTGMSVLVATGDYRVPTTDDYAYTGWNTTNVAITVTTADPANPRIDTVVLYVDKSASTSPSPPNNPGVAKMKIVNGTPNAVPTAPNGTTIQSSVGAGNPYIILADVRVNAAVTSILNANITDRRTRATIANDFVTTNSILNQAVTSAKIADGTIVSTDIATNGVVTSNITDANVTTAKIADSNVTTAKVADGAVTTRKFKPSIINSNFTPAASRFTTTSSTPVQITNCSMTYTSGSTPEKLYLFINIMASITAGSGTIYLYVDSTAQTTTLYIDAATPWPRSGQAYWVDVAANTTITLSLRAAAAGSQTLSVTNETAAWVPTIRGFSIYNGP